ncbi:MAG: ABC transporter permease subunit [Bacilli bacterium]|nr:ABC transporter permease subunit [Bacilli bacterium]MBN2877162.1 ABC transporter permease subunit [Bacilli bacterium]
MKKTGMTILSVFVLFLIWVIAGMLVNNPLILPRFEDVLIAFGSIFIRASSLSAILHTILRLLIGLTLASVAGLLLGVIAGFRSKFAIFFNPIVTIFRTVPVISITVILLIAFGFGLTPYIITFLMLFPLIYQGTYGAIVGLDKELIDVYRLENNNFWSGLLHCYLPLISSNIRTSLLQSLGLGIKVLVMAEYLSQTRDSIGNQLYLAKVNLNFDQVFAWTLLLILLALVFELLINHYRPIIEKVKKSPN